jgi:tetratricopeptide (TPR) repeat protein
MYSRKVKAVFGFMVFLMAVGYLVLILNSFPAFSSMIGGNGSSSNSTQKIVDDARKVVAKQHCKAGMPAGHARSKCKIALEDMGSGYQTLSQPTDPNATSLPKDAERNLEKSTEAYKLLVAIDPKDKDSQQFLANAYASTGKFDLAVPLYKALVQQDPSEPLYLYAYARSAQSASQQDPALKDVALAAYAKYLKLFPDESNSEDAKAAIQEIKNPQSGSSAITGAG